MEQVLVTPTAKAKHSHYIHLNVESGFSDMVTFKINSYMLAQDSYDPRAADDFPTRLLAKGDKDSVFARRFIMKIHKNAIEFWRVRKNFSLEGLGRLISTFPFGTEIRVIRIVGSQHEAYTFYGYERKEVFTFDLVKYKNKKREKKKKLPKKDYYIMIDMKNTNKSFLERINSFFVGQDAYDPFFSNDYPSSQIPEGKRDTLKLRRVIMKRGKAYTQFWKVRKELSWKKFAKMIAKHNSRCTARVIKIMDRRYETHTFFGLREDETEDVI